MQHRMDSEREIKDVDYVIVTGGVTDYQVVQQHCGFAHITLEGRFGLTDHTNTPVISVFEEDTGEALIYQQRPEYDSDGSWRFELSLPAGKVVRIETGVLLKAALYDERFLGCGQIIRQVASGEVYVISGQSNAVGYARQPVTDPPHPLVRMRMPDGKWLPASHPIGYDGPLSQAANSDPILPGHSPWLNFGKIKVQQMGMPVGVVQTGKNGVAIAAFAPDMPLFAMLNEALISTQAAHFIFYQGCSDLYESEVYEERLEKLLLAVRELVEDCILVQISGATDTTSPSEGWIRVREAQRSVAARLGLPLVATWDLCRYSDDIHLSSADNLLLGRRIAYASTARSAIPLAVYRTIDGVEVIFNDDVDTDSTSIPSLILEDDCGDLYKPDSTLWDRNRVCLITAVQAKKVRPAFDRYAGVDPEWKVPKPVALPYFFLSTNEK